MFLLSLKRQIFGYKKIDENPEKICKKIITKCYKKSSKYNKKYFIVSEGHFKQFYSRDFGIFIEPLIKLGWKKECFSTLDYALKVFSENNKITTTISEDEPVDFFDYAVDSLPFILRTIRICLENGYPEKKIIKYKKFITLKIKEYKLKVYDEKTKLVKPNKYFSSARDHYKRKSSSYDNSAMIGAMEEINKINKIMGYRLFEKNINIKESKNEFKKNLFNGKYFYADLDKKKHITSDANIFPFYWNIFNNKKMINSCYKSIRQEKLDNKIPIKYSEKRDKKKELKIPEFFAPNYEGNTYWPHIGYCYLETFGKIDKKNLKRNIKNIINLMKTHNNFLEVYKKNTEPYKSLFYTADSNMIWCSGYFWLSKSLKKPHIKNNF
ncbi:MAG: hypothetical protein ACQESP_12265 [Candidatus Muiribacteriota bacterium]